MKMNNQKNILLSVLLTAFFGFSASGAPVDSNTKNWTYIDQNKEKVLISIYDEANRSGEEDIQLYIGNSKKNLKVDTAITDNYSASYFVENNDGETLEDLSFSFSFGKAYDQVKELLSQKEFRKSFDYLPESCEETTRGFLIISDNVNQKLTGFCLKPQAD